MRFFHLSDLHLGKTLEDCSLLEDQSFWIDRLLEAADREHPDAVVIAGDIYDRAVPSVEAMELFEKLIYGLEERKLWVLIIPGNHDSAVRLSNISNLLCDKKIFIADGLKNELTNELSAELTHVAVRDDDGRETVFWLMPYVYPKLVGAALKRDDLNSYDAAVRALLEKQPMDPGACNVLIAHQNVLCGAEKPLHSDSESYIGNLGEVDASAFDGFDYVALGHIHNAQKIGRETVRYAGCPLYYDFSETDREKKLTVVTVNGKNSVEIDHLELPLLHTLKRVEGTFEELKEIGKKLENRDRYYFKAVVKGKSLPVNADAVLRSMFGDGLIKIIPERYISGPAVETEDRTAAPEASIGVQFEQFYHALNGGEYLDAERGKILEAVLEQQEHSEQYYRDYTKVPKDETGELLNIIFEMIGEEKA